MFLKFVEFQMYNFFRIDLLPSISHFENCEENLEKRKYH